MDEDLINVESLTVCSYCQQKFNTTDHNPKMLECKHLFCLKCIETNMVNGTELNCVLCLKKHDLGENGVESLETHTPVLSLAHHLTTLGFSDMDPKTKTAVRCTSHALSWTLWCHSCLVPLCRMCFTMEHNGHHVTSHNEAREYFYNEMQSELNVVSHMLQEIQRLCSQQLEFQIRVLEACATLKTSVEADIALSSVMRLDLRDSRDVLSKVHSELDGLISPIDIQANLLNVATERRKVEIRYKELVLQGRLEDAVSKSSQLIDMQTMTAIHAGDLQTRSPRKLQTNLPHPIVFLANYCMYQIYSRTNGCKTDHTTAMSLVRSTLPSTLPRYYFDIEMDQVAMGRFVIETRPDLAPKMAHNFGLLCSAEIGPSYKFCTVFQCWPNQSIITGDYETNNGRGGHAIYEEGYFMPDETKMAAVRGAVGMRRTQKRRDHLGLVGSQFRVILNDTSMRGFSAFFGHVVEGLELIEQLASTGDHTGKPSKNIIITACGHL